ncbi:MAG TPA: hypothetical protein VN635_12140 [Conexibacter sp.]|nr:hypothetical protein [Conexibacter sp.]
MRDELSSEAVRPHLRRASPAPESVVLALYASLRGTAAYVALLVDRIDMAHLPDAQIERTPADVPADLLVRLTALCDALRAAADAVLCQLDPLLARRAWAAADVASQAAPGGEGSR